MDPILSVAEIWYSYEEDEYFIFSPSGHHLLWVENRTGRSLTDDKIYKEISEDPRFIYIDIL